MRSPLQAPVYMREECSHVPADLPSPLSESPSGVYTRDILSDRAVASRGITAVGATSLYLPRSEIALRVYTRYGFSDSRTAARVLSVKNLVPGVHARWVFWHMTRLPTVGKLSSAGKHVSRVHTGRRFLHRTAPSASDRSCSETRRPRRGVGGLRMGRATHLLCKQAPGFPSQGSSLRRDHSADSAPPRSSHSAPPHSLTWFPSRVTGPGPFIVHSHGRMHDLKLAE